MGRKLMRVPMDFAWPLKQVWGGYLNPFYSQSIKCPRCDGSGYAPDAKRFSDQWYGNAPFDPVAYGATPLTVDHPSVRALAERNVTREPGYYGTSPGAADREARRLWDFMHKQWSHHLIQADVDVLLKEGRLADFTRAGKTPTADEVNAWSIGGFGHDAINHWICVKARCKREGVPVSCGCHDGKMWPSEKVRRQCERWKQTEPPVGDGFQLWETTSEGSPTSPVFATMEELCEWCADNATTFASFKASAIEWRRMLDADFVVHKEQLGDGVAAVFI
jgi:hypothetical protein